jgi:hypothetical protein
LRLYRRSPDVRSKIAMQKTYHVEARWDPQAEVWVSTSDVPGLVLETATLAEFEALMRALVPELIVENGGPAGQASVEWVSSGTFELA